MYDASLRENLQRVEENIARALERAGRGAGVTIVAVTKGHPVAAVHAAIAAGLRNCGENRVPELEEKVGQAGRDAVRWHLIGHLQRNKVKRAMQLFDLIHSIDSLRLAQELSKEAARAAVQLGGLVQVNVSGEETKGGFEGTESIERAADEIVALAELPALELRGLMTMAPYTDDEKVLHQTFARTRALAELVRARVPAFGAELSMGMSNDYQIAVQEGSTMVRLGTTLFGERQT